MTIGRCIIRANTTCTHRHTQIHTNDELTRMHVCMSMQRVHRVALKIESETPIPKPITAAQFKEIKKELVRINLNIFCF